MKNQFSRLALASAGLIISGLACAMSLPASAGSVTTPTVTAPTVTVPSVTAPSVTTPTVKTPTMPTASTSSCAGQLKVVKNLLKKAPAGAGKDTAKTHYDKAVTASKTHDDKTCLSELDAASAALK